jgi:asparagine synthase (glutamine-hydrolysing)
MCGITGFITGKPVDRESGLGYLQQMTTALAHRGPDAEGLFLSTDGQVGFGHRRLSILDLSPAGAQPMRTSDGRFVLTYNGEIYNFKDLRKQLQTSGCIFNGGSDTEVLLYAIAAWGVERTLSRLNGMFAFSLWDAKTEELWLARDRFGEKPLYYAWHNQILLFGSELKALAKHPAFRREINPSALAQFLRFNYVPWPDCIFKDAYKLGPGHFLRLKPGQAPGNPVPFWSLSTTIAQRKISPIDAEDPALIDLLDATIGKAVCGRMVSDVPLGAFLSGGIDSSTVVALMQAHSRRPIKTFTIGFWEAPYNEAEEAARVARHLGTEHHELYLSSRECTDVIATLPSIYDEPFADSSQIPTTLVSRFTRKHVTVALSGDAGDELFGGYNRYFWTARVWPRLERMPCWLRHRFAKLIHAFSPAWWERWFDVSNLIVPAKLKVRGGGEKLHKLAMAMDAETVDELYRGFVSQWQNPEEVLINGSEPPFLARHLGALPGSLGSIERMMYLDSITYLPSDILCKVDRASMASGLEARVPFLDNEVVELAWSLPLDVKIHRGIGKWPLRRLLNRYVPEKLFGRPKMGFGIPIDSWLRGPLRPWAEEMLDEKRLKESGYFNVPLVRSRWQEHLSGRRNYQHLLWIVIMFEAWRREWKV